MPRSSNDRCESPGAGPFRRVLLVLLAVLLGLTSTSLALAGDADPFFFIQLTDPQFGMYTKNEDFAQETANFKFAVATANRLKPAFVVVTGDLVNKPGDAAQAEEYLRIAGRLDRAIRLYHVPGNHDVGNDPTAESVAAYTARFGPDHYRFRHGNTIGLVLNSTVLHSPEKAPKLAEEQVAWLKAELEKAKQEAPRHIVVFQHHPWFVTSPEEPNDYHSVPQSARREGLDLLRQYGVTHVFAGHLHRNQIARDGSIEMVTTGAIGQPLGKSKSGLRVVIVRPEGIEHQFYEMGEVPNRIMLVRADK